MILRKNFATAECLSGIKANKCLIMRCPFNLPTSALLSYWAWKAPMEKIREKKKLIDFWFDMSSAIDAQKTSMTGCIPQWPPFRAFNNLLHSILKSCSQRGENKNLRGEVSSLWSYQNVSLEQFVSVNHDVWMRFSKFFSIFCKILPLDWQIKPQIRRFCQSWVNYQ